MKRDAEPASKRVRAEITEIIRQFPHVRDVLVNTDSPKDASYFLGYRDGISNSPSEDDDYRQTIATTYTQGYKDGQADRAYYLERES